MHCDNCKNRVERHLDDIDGVVAKVNLAKKQAEVSLYKDGVPDDLIKNTIEALDFQVTSMEEK
jgi:copper chaperone CopZ